MRNHHVFALAAAVAVFSNASVAMADIASPIPQSAASAPAMQSGSMMHSGSMSSTMKKSKMMKPKPMMHVTSMKPKPAASAHASGGTITNPTH